MSTRKGQESTRRPQSNAKKTSLRNSALALSLCVEKQTASKVQGLQRVDEMESAPVVGRFYLVPCVFEKGQWFPILGPYHEDREIIGFWEHHHHFDLRFVGAVQLRRWNRGTVLRPHPRAIAEHLARVQTFPVDPPQVIYLRLRCRRPMPEWPVEFQRSLKPAPWLGALEEAHAGYTLSCATCPHRGFKLGNLPQNADGVVVCPGHGLAWNLRTGRMVRRVKAEQAGGGEREQGGEGERET